MLLNGTDPTDIARAAHHLAEGELLALPTETVYGLGARADDDAAVAKIFAAKGRPSDHPLIVHVLDAADAVDFAAALPPVAQRLMAAFWPGPLTLILPRAPGVGAAAAGGQDSIGLRCPAHPVARALLAEAKALGVHGVAAPSANRFGRVSPTRAAHVESEFEGRVWVLDGGDCAVGIESSIVDCSRAHPVLLRPGVLTPGQIEAVAGEPLRTPDAQAPRASGTLAAHYAPSAVVRLLDAPTLAQRLGQQQWPAGLAVYSRTLSPVLGPLWRSMPGDAAAAAQQLFAVLRELDDAGAGEIWIELPPRDVEWDGVRDRLSRAAAAFAS
ncbi:L-threonylcarbamoyladenylate synthase [Paucibacter sp. PLA-PC-4]|uniref:L-threonylcarbamoyladenylate synthase n=1 Tax=Paucibacter sp. PLA-PC-4 TaxID=2993655 RepID=UPI00224883AB|nr:L-threonylcarbamoyladenylate synthase [Paucibacter sp. PLA-PC-4]MCX2860742.1 L-threonylcarbamoyladenylate synthase [Paucibacter sp. PLA-PC-4]